MDMTGINARLHSLSTRSVWCIKLNMRASTNVLRGTGELFLCCGKSNDPSVEALSGSLQRDLQQVNVPTVMTLVIVAILARYK